MIRRPKNEETESIETIITQTEVGRLSINTMVFTIDGETEFGREIVIRKAIPEKLSFGTIIFQGTLKDLIDKLEPKPESEEDLKVVCAWCGKGLSEHPTSENSEVTHSMCQECFNKGKK